MAGDVKWTKRQIQCPERMGRSELFLEWHLEGPREILNGIHCDNPLLKDLSGGDCQWSCWEKVSELLE